MCIHGEAAQLLANNWLYMTNSLFQKVVGILQRASRMERLPEAL